jgi:hypothetical protein
MHACFQAAAGVVFVMFGLPFRDEQEITKQSDCSPLSLSQVKA